MTVLVNADDLAVEWAEVLAGCIVVEDGHAYVDLVRLADMIRPADRLEEVGK